MRDDIEVSFPKSEHDVSLARAGVFVTTHWSVVVEARDEASPKSAAALEQLCQTYWYPLYAFVRRRGHSHEDARDLTQAFFARFLEKHYLRSIDSSLGKFRTFLLTSMTYFLANEWDKSQAARRGGGAEWISIEAATAEERYQVEPLTTSSPENLYDRRWAETVMTVVLDRLAKETEDRRFGVLKNFLLEDRESVSYDSAAAELGISVPAVTSAIFRMRGRFRAILLEEIRHTVQTPDSVESEIRHLLASLSD